LDKGSDNQLKYLWTLNFEFKLYEYSTGIKGAIDLLFKHATKKKDIYIIRLCTFGTIIVWIMKENEFLIYDQ